MVFVSFLLVALLLAAFGFLCRWIVLMIHAKHGEGSQDARVRTIGFLGTIFLLMGIALRFLVPVTAEDVSIEASRALQDVSYVSLVLGAGVLLLVLARGLFAFSDRAQ